MSRGIEPNRLSSDIASVLNELSTMRRDPPRAGSTLNSSGRILQLGEQAATRKEVAKHRRRPGPKQQIDGMAESTPNASSRILQLAEVAALRKEGANLQQRSKQGSMGSLRKRETTSSRGMSAPTSSADTQLRARGSSQRQFSPPLFLSDLI
ncbi:hypothetical protein K438DRAFT_1148446 [Mycena galopus ATCC 62051]|nr:hypothetical protein K438DRAFT_1148446 [Mycena galopus ATCC 62051]